MTKVALHLNTDWCITCKSLFTCLFFESILLSLFFWVYLKVYSLTFILSLYAVKFDFLSLHNFIHIFAVFLYLSCQFSHTFAMHIFSSFMIYLYEFTEKFKRFDFIVLLNSIPQIYSSAQFYGIRLNQKY